MDVLLVDVEGWEHEVIAFIESSNEFKIDGHRALIIFIAEEKLVGDMQSVELSLHVDVQGAEYRFLCISIK